MMDPMLEAIQAFPEISEQFKKKTVLLVSTAIEAELRPNRVAPVAGNEDVDVYWRISSKPHDYVSATISEEPDEDGVDLVAAWPDPSTGLTVEVFNGPAELLKQVRNRLGRLS